VTVTDLKGNLGEFMPKLGPLADSLKIDVDNLQNVVKNLDAVAKGADTVLGTANTFIGTTDKQLQEQMKQLHVVLLNLKVLTTHAKALVETLAEKPNRLIFSGKPAKLTSEAEILKSSKPLPARKGSSISCKTIGIRAEYMSSNIGYVSSFDSIEVS